MRFLRILFAMFVLTASLVSAPTPASAQETTATSTLSGLVVDIGTSGEGSFVDTTPEPYDDWGYLQEDFTVLLDQAEIHISFAQGDVNTESWFTESHEVLAGSFDTYTVLEEVVSTENGWALTRETYWLEYELVTYSEFYFHDVNDVSLGVSIHTTEANFIEYVEWAQNNILVGGDPVAMLAGTEHLEPLIAGTAGVDPREIPGFESTVADWEEQGLVSETEWISPQYQTPISWDANLWQYPFHNSNAIIVDESLVEDMITLKTPDSSGIAYVHASLNPSGFTPEDWEAWWQTDDFFAALTGDTGSVITLLDFAHTETNASVIFHTVDYFGNPTVTIIDTYIDESGVAITAYITAAPDDISDVYTAYWDGVMAYGDFYPLVWNLEEIEALEVD